MARLANAFLLSCQDRWPEFPEYYQYQRSAEISRWMRTDMNCRVGI
jgi:hypothetical protein